MAVKGYVGLYMAMYGYVGLCRAVYGYVKLWRAMHTIYQLTGNHCMMLTPRTYRKGNLHRLAYKVKRES